jgi:hypothetical protein
VFEALLPAEPLERLGVLTVRVHPRHFHGMLSPLQPAMHSFDVHSERVRQTAATSAPESSASAAE